MDLLTGLIKISDGLGNTKIKNLVRYDYNMIGGGIAKNEIHRLIIGIILLVIAVIIYMSIDVWIPINAHILRKHLIRNKHKMKIRYEVNNVVYKKFVYKKLFDRGEDTVKIYYDKTNPNYIKHYNLDYKVVIPILVIGGIYFIISYKKVDALI